MKSESTVPAVLRWLLVLVVALVPWLVRTVFFPGYPGADDAYIHLAIIDCLRESGTWGINPGEPVNLSTSPLFTVLFYLCSFLVRDPMALGMVLSCVAVTVAIMLTFLIAERYLRSFWHSLLVAGIAAFNIQLWRWTGTFMEATFAYCIVVVNLYVHLRLVDQERVGFGSLIGQGLLLGSSVLLRPELGLLALALLAHTLVVVRPGAGRRVAWVAGAFLVPLVAYAVWANATFGSVIPSTFFAKTSSGIQFVNKEVANDFGKVVFSAFPSLLFLGFLALSLRLGGQSERERCRDTWLFALITLLGFLFFYLKAPNLQSAARYFLPFLATTPLLAVPLLLAVKASRGPKLAFFAAGLAVLAQAMSAFFLNQRMIAPVLQRMRSDYVATMVDASNTIIEQVPQGQPVLVYYDIGVVSWQIAGRRKIYDGGALASPDLRGLSLEEMIDKTGVDYLLESLGNPEYPLEIKGEIIWERTFKSHGVDTRDRTFATRLYRLSH